MPALVSKLEPAVGRLRRQRASACSERLAEVQRLRAAGDRRVAGQARALRRARPAAAARARRAPARPRLELPRAEPPGRPEHARRRRQEVGDGRRLHRRHRRRRRPALPRLGERQRGQGRHRRADGPEEGAARAGDRAREQAAARLPGGVGRRQPDVPGRDLHRRRAQLRQPGAAVGGRHSADRRRARLVDGRRRLPAGPVGLRDPGARPLEHLPRRPAAREGRDRRGRDRRGARRRRDARRGHRPRRVPVRERRPRDRAGARAAGQAAVGHACPRRARPRSPTAVRRAGTAGHRAGRRARALRRARGHRAPRRRLRLPRVQGALRQRDGLRPRARRRPARRHPRQQRADPAERLDQGGAVHPALRPDAARRSSSCRTPPATWSARWPSAAARSSTARR